MSTPNIFFLVSKEDKRNSILPMLSVSKTPSVYDEEKNICEHPSLDTDGYCLKCGMMFQMLADGAGLYNTSKTFTNRHTLTKIVEKNITPELSKLNLPDNVKVKAEDIYARLQFPTRRKQRRKLLVFYCVYNAYNELGIHEDHKELATTIGLKPAEINKSLSMFSESQTGYRPVTVQILPEVYIEKFGTQLNFSPELIQTIKELSKEITDKDVNLIEESPQKVAAGIIQYYMTINGLNIKKKDFAKIISLTEVTINNMYKKIYSIMNA